MAARAGPKDFIVVDAERRVERAGGMTRGAVVGGIDMREILAHGGCVVMTSDAAAEHFGMIHAQHGTPCHG